MGGPFVGAPIRFSYRVYHKFPQLNKELREEITQKALILCIII